MRFDRDEAVEVLRREASATDESSVDPHWVSSIGDFSAWLQRDGLPKTHIAFLGTAILAKALNTEVDVFAIKAGRTNRRAYSARSLGHGSLVPNSVELGIDLGVSGREPLNNQPYFRHDRVSLEMVVHDNARPIVHQLCQILEQLDAIESHEAALTVLRSFIYVRRQYAPQYQPLGEGTLSIRRRDLVDHIERFVANDSEGGKRAQAIVAGLMDLYAGTTRVVAGRINDPDRHLPGDVGIKTSVDSDTWEKIFEVRDKAVSVEDAFLFAQKAVNGGVSEAAIVAAALGQGNVDFGTAEEWARQRGVSLSIFFGWPQFVEQSLFWSESPQPIGISEAITLIYDRLIEVEVSQSGADLWRQLVDEPTTS